jgi:hypothetical protein
MKAGLNGKSRVPQSLCIVLASFLFLCLWPGATAFGAQVVDRHLPASAAGLQPRGRLPSSQRLKLTIGLPLRNRDALTNLLAQLYDPTSPQFHRFVSPAEFAQRFGPAESDYQSVIAFAKADGLDVTRTHSNRTLVELEGTVADIERVFHVRMQTYPHPTEARTFFAPDRDPSIDIAVPVLSIKGLDNYSLPHPLFHRVAASSAQGLPDDNTGTGPSGWYIGSDYRHAYAPGVTNAGTGQSVALFELDGYYPGDVTNYEALARLPGVTVSNILVSGFDGSPGPNNGEVSLDIEIAMSMAPGLSSVLVYEGNSGGDPILNQIATDNRAAQISSSWGFTIDSSTEQIFQQFVAQGQAFFEACGDLGAYPSTVDTPADDPMVTCVGGTVLTTDTNGETWSSETTWQSGGGGISTVYAIPTWQQGVSMATNQGSVSARNVPDVALIAANCWSIQDNGQGYITFGTSIAAPMWAGFMALANQQAAAGGRPRLGFLNPLIYDIGTNATYATAFHDITTGNDTNASSPNRFFATPGFDLCTGWGTPAGSNLINALVNLGSVTTPPSGYFITSIARTNSGVLVKWNTTGGSTNVVQSARSLTNSFADLSGPILAAGSGPVSTNYLDVHGATNSSRFYRIKVGLPPPSDNAADPAYAGGWLWGDDGGTGFGPWVLTGTGAINSQWNGFYIGSSTTNAAGQGPGIDVNGDSWGIYANNNNFATAFRQFNSPLQAGQTFSFSMDNGYINSGGPYVGFVLRNGNVTTTPTDYVTGWRFQFVFFGGSSDYQIYDNAGQSDSGIFFTPTGLRFVFTLTTTNTYSLQVIDNNTGATNSFSGTLNGTPGSTVNSIALFNFGAGTSPASDCFFNSFKITGP